MIKKNLIRLALVFALSNYKDYEDTSKEPSYMSYSRIVYFFIFVFFVTANAHGEEMDRQGTQWCPYIEWSIQAKIPDGNPFDVQARAIFIHSESGDSINTQLYYGSGDTWKFRFTAPRIGEWHFTTHSNYEPLSGQTGVVVISPNKNDSAHGFMKAFGSKWGWEGTEQAFIPQYVMAPDPESLLMPDGTVNDSRIDELIKEFVGGHGFTGFHIPVRGGWFKGENPDLRIYRVVETIITKTHARGGACHIWLWGSGSGGKKGEGPIALASGPMSKIDRRNLTYLAARLGPLPGWSMGYGFDCENGWASVDELDAWKAFLKSKMGYPHFLGARVGSDEKGLFAVHPQPPRPPHDAGNRAPIADQYTFWLGGDYIGYTSYRPLYPRYVQVIEHHGERPSFEEDRFRLRNEDKWNYKDYNEDLTRRGLWHSAMAGGVANIWGNLLPDSDNGGSRPYKIKEQIKTYSQFFEHRFLKEMTTEFLGPELRLSTPDGTHAIIYREDADLVRLDLTRMKGPMPVVAVDIRAPYKELDVGILSSQHHAWQTPYRSDWAIAVGSF